jgi:hypothetical protein
MTVTTDPTYLIIGGVLVLIILCVGAWMDR